MKYVRKSALGKCWFNSSITFLGFFFKALNG